MELVLALRKNRLQQRKSQEGFLIVYLLPIPPVTKVECAGFDSR
jgi:hypothetical protein